MLLYAPQTPDFELVVSHYVCENAFRTQPQVTVVNQRSLTGVFCMAGTSCYSPFPVLMEILVYLVKVPKYWSLAFPSLPKQNKNQEFDWGNPLKALLLLKSALTQFAVPLLDFFRVCKGASFFPLLCWSSGGTLMNNVCLHKAAWILKHDKLWNVSCGLYRMEFNFVACGIQNIVESGKARASFPGSPISCWSVCLFPLLALQRIGGQWCFLDP